MQPKSNANTRRGEIGATIDDKPRVLCLTLGALAELENAFGAEDLAALVRRFSTGGLAARDLTRILGAGLRGGGHEVSDEDVGRMTMEGGAGGFAALVARLLEATFTDGESAGARDTNP